MISGETPVGSRVRCYTKLGEESTSWVGRTTTEVQAGYVTIRCESDSGRVYRVSTTHIEPIGARPFVSHKVQCPNCQHEFER